MLQRPPRFAFLCAALLTGMPALPSHAIAAQSASCSTSGRVLKTIGGAGLGAFVGLVAVKIVHSDWTDASRTPDGIRAQNRGMITGALVGAAVGNLPFLSARCGGPRGIPGTVIDRRVVISSDEIRKFGPNGSAYDLVYSLRKQWLNPRGAELSEAPEIAQDQQRGGRVVKEGTPLMVVYLDNARMGDQEQLRTIPLAGVVTVRYYDPAAATLKWGQGHRHGAIQVITASETIATP